MPKYVCSIAIMAELSPRLRRWSNVFCPSDGERGIVTRHGDAIVVRNPRRFRRCYLLRRNRLRTQTGSSDVESGGTTHANVALSSSGACRSRGHLALDKRLIAPSENDAEIPTLGGVEDGLGKKTLRRSRLEDVHDGRAEV